MVPCSGCSFSVYSLGFGKKGEFFLVMCGTFQVLFFKVFFGRY